MKDFDITITTNSLSPTQETWRIGFEHRLSYSQRDFAGRPVKGIEPDVQVTMVASKEGSTPAMSRHEDLGCFKLLGNRKPEVITVSPLSDFSEITDALVREGWASRLGQRVERYQDYPGSDEMDEFRYDKLDVTNLYNRYVTTKQQEMTESPIDNIRQGKYEAMNARDRRDYLTCDIGGVQQKEKWFGRYNDESLRLAEKYPEYLFQVHDLAGKVFKKECQDYKEAQQRITEIKVLKLKNEPMDWHIRCKVDGVQQMARKVTMVDVADYVSHMNHTALAAKYFADVLAQERELSQGIKR